MLLINPKNIANYNCIQKSNSNKKKYIKNKIIIVRLTVRVGFSPKSITRPESYT